MDDHIRVILAKPGLDGHESGVRLVARVLRDAGMEVIYLGARQTPEMIVESALQEDADIIGLSILSGVHKHTAKEMRALLTERNATHIPVFMGGIIPSRDIPELKALGVQAVFGPGTHTGEVVSVVREIVERSRSDAQPVQA